MRKVHIFDTTLRDGEQSPGVHLNRDEKVKIAKQLELLGVDRIEAGFPAASKGEIENIQAISKTITNTSVCGLARAHKNDIDACYEALKDAVDPCIHVFIATSPIHRKYKLNMTKDEIVDTAVRSIQYARKYFEKIEFSLEDASRTELEFMYRVIDEAIKAGASIINLPDTVGFASPEDFGQMFTNVKEHVPNTDRILLSTHCHNDLGMATANSLAAIKGGADQVEGTINGIGERAGNTALEEVALALETRQDIYKAKTDIVLSEIYKTSELVRELTGMVVQPNKAIVGEHAFQHESGIHQDGMLKESTTYEIINPETIGVTASTLVLGKHSGRHALGEKLAQLGYDLTREQLTDAFEKFKEQIDEKHYITDEELHKIVNDEFEYKGYQLIKANIHYKEESVFVELIVSDRNDEERKVTAEALDVVCAIEEAIASLEEKSFTFIDYSLRKRKIDDLTIHETSVQLKSNEHLYIGRETDRDVFKSLAKAFLHAYNQLFTKKASNSSSFTYLN